MSDCLLLHPQTGYEYDSYNEYVIIEYEISLYNLFHSLVVKYNS